MNCTRCKKPLQRYEHAAAATFAGKKAPQPSFCDECTRSHAWRGGSPEALNRLIDGGRDEGELARIAEAVPSLYKGMGRPDYTGALRAAAKASGFDLPENLR